MNCHLAQKKIIDCFAAGVAVLPAEVAGHQETCATCQDFLVAQQKLFRALDEGLESLVRVPAPPSLVPRVRARLDGGPVPTSWWRSVWSFGALTAIVFLALSLHVLWHHPRRPADLSVAFRREAHPGPKAEAASPRTNALARRTRTRAAVLPAHQEPSEPFVEVIALPEERAAFAKFVAEVPEKRDLALALTRPTHVPANEPREIGLLEIAALEVKSLAEAAAE